MKGQSITHQVFDELAKLPSSRDVRPNNEGNNGRNAHVQSGLSRARGADKDMLAALRYAWRAALQVMVPQPEPEYHRPAAHVAISAELVRLTLGGKPERRELRVDTTEAIHRGRLDLDMWV